MALSTWASDTCQRLEEGSGDWPAGGSLKHRLGRLLGGPRTATALAEDTPLPPLP